MLGVELCPETAQELVEGYGRRIARFQANNAASERVFQEVPGDVEFAIGAAKVNTREEDWKDLKIGVLSKCEAGKPSFAGVIIVPALVMIATAKDFYKQ
jgi:hypothetical protein